MGNCLEFLFIYHESKRRDVVGIMTGYIARRLECIVGMEMEMLLYINTIAKKTDIP